MAYPILAPDPTSPKLDERVNTAIRSAFERRETISEEELALILECGQRMLELYDMIYDDLPPILPSLTDSEAKFAMEKTHGHNQ